MYRLSFYVPASHLDAVKSAVFAAGAGKIGAYDSCCWQTQGQGQFRPLEGSQPYLGEQGQIEVCEEYKVEMVCSGEHIRAAVDALLQAHPYEEPAWSAVLMHTELPE